MNHKMISQKTIIAISSPANQSACALRNIRRNFNQESGVIIKTDLSKVKSMC